MTDQSPAELEQDAERVRAQIADTAESLKDKMSPGQLMDEVVGYLKDGDASQFLTNLKTQVRDNPLSLAMIGGGLAWLMMGSGPSARPTTTTRRPTASGHVHPQTAGTYGAVSPSTRPSEPYGTGHSGSSSSSGTSLSDKASGAASSVGDTLSGVGSRIGSAAGTASDTIGSAAGSVGDSARSAAQSMREGLHDARDAAGERLSYAADAGADLASRARNTFLDVLEREPLVLGAIGVAVGAAIGAMLPTTRVEQDYLGEASAQARDKASAAFSQGIEKARHVAEDAYAAARDEADRQGLMPGETPLAEKVAAVARAAGNELKSAKDETLHSAEKKADEATDKLSTDDKDADRPLGDNNRPSGGSTPI